MDIVHVPPRYPIPVPACYKRRATSLLYPRLHSIAFHSHPIPALFSVPFRSIQTLQCTTSAERGCWPSSRSRWRTRRRSSTAPGAAARRPTTSPGTPTRSCATSTPRTLPTPSPPPSAAALARLRRFPTSASASSGGYQRMFCGLDDIYCVFLGRLDNLSGLIRQYGLCGRSTNEALLVIEAYRTLRDRGPYPADQVVKDLAGAFAFVVFDNRSGAVFAALGGNDGGDSVPLYWGVAADGSAVISDDRDVVKRGCGKSYAPFPAGCMFHSEGGLKSFEHPMNRLKAMPRVDSEGAMCGATFKVDTFTKINSMPRVGSATNWAAAWDDAS
ncbi:unnamed protein product [Miscanthus lutarioriparius]|uniref:DUF3700 domain-containing protein n=1 Tax=Miscanthus lutarioriparius TaxID=422564 RepID=A0A811QS75_9POAL|nr:unnamed protein product [Miscanthus lutarioriparius]